MTSDMPITLFRSTIINGDIAVIMELEINDTTTASLNGSGGGRLLADDQINKFH